MKINKNDKTSGWLGKQQRNFKLPKSVMKEGMSSLISEKGKGNTTNNSRPISHINYMKWTHFQKDRNYWEKLKMKQKI